MQYETVIGLEVHAQLATYTKIFCGCRNRFGSDPNTQTCPVCLGMPGVLPVLNKKVVESAMKMAMATNCKINDTSVFARKNYFYPDLPKGYQISQYEEPFCEYGWIDIVLESGEERRLGITRIHLEEDAGKSVHDEAYVSKNESMVDVNRCGTPLIEIVSEPDMRTPEEAALYLTKIRHLVRWLGICDGNMEEGSLRCDANISLRPAGQKDFGVKTELKNMNSINGVRKALEYEVKRQTRVLNYGGEIVQQTLLWDESAGKAAPMRGKEDAHDYRYFPDPDLVPLTITADWKKTIESILPELPDDRKFRWLKDFNLPEYDIHVLTEDKSVSDYTESLFKLSDDPKQAANWVMGEVLRVLNESEDLTIDALQVTPEKLAEIITLVSSGKISHSAGKKVFDDVAASGDAPVEVVDRLGLAQVSDSSALESIVDEVIASHPAEVEKYRAGKKQIIGFLVGQVMKASKGKANPGMVNEILRSKLEL